MYTVQFAKFLGVKSLPFLSYFIYSSTYLFIYVYYFLKINLGEKEVL